MELRKTKKMDLGRKRTNFQLVALFLCATVFFGLNNLAHAQNEPVITLDHDAGYLKKVAKSPAKDLILYTDTLIAKAVEAKTNFSSYEELVKNRRSFVSDSYLIEENKKKILELDSKWKTDKIDQHLDQYSWHYTYCKDFDDHINMTEINTYFSVIINSLGHLKGQELLTYASSLKMDEIDQKLKLGAEIIKRYKRAETYAFSNFKSNLVSFRDDFIKKYKNTDLNQPLPKDGNLIKMQEIYLLVIPETKARLVIYPDNAELEAMLAQMESNNKIIEENLANFYVSDFHKSHVNQIFFSDHKITFGTETEKDFRTEFKGGETIYVIQYLSTEIDAQKINSHRFGRPGLDNKDKIVNFTVKAIVEEEGQNKVNVLQYALVPKIGTLTNEEIVRTLPTLRYLSKQTEYLNQQTEEDVSNYWVSHSSYGEDNQASFIVKISATENYTKIYEDIRDIKSNTIPMPKVGMTDASAEASVKKGVDYLAENDSRYGNINVVKVIIVSKAWEYETFFNSSQIKSRSLNNVYVVCKDEKGKCFFLTGSLYQKKEGSTYNSGTFSTSSDFDFKDANGDYIQQDGNYRLYFNCSKL